MVPPLAAPPGELRTDLSQIDDTMAIRMARRFENAGDLVSAMNMYRRALRAAPENTTALLAVARIYAQNGAGEEAARYYSRILQLEPQNSGAAAGVAENLIYKGEATRTIALIREFMISAPGTPALFNILGIAHDLDGAHGEAQLAYAEGLNLAPEDAAITSNLALSFAVREEYHTALALLERVLGDARGSDQAGRSIARQNLALVYALSGQLETAVEIAKIALSDKEAAINSVFYARLPALNSKEKAKAVFLGTLPAPPERHAAAPTEKMPQPEPVLTPPSSAEEKHAAASRIIEGKFVAEAPVPEASGETTGIAGPGEASLSMPAPVAAAEASGGPASEQNSAPPPLAGAMAGGDYPPFWVQLGSYRSPERARAGWATLSAEFPLLLAGYTGYQQTYESAERGQFFRLMVQASETRSAANLVCGTFKFEGMDCLVIKTGRNIAPLPSAEGEDGSDQP